MSQQEVSLIELGRLAQASLRTVRAIVEPMGGTVEIQVRWRGGDIDRVADEGHAVLVAAAARALEAAGWVIVPEVSYSVYGERGSIDLVAWHSTTRTLLVVEVKTELTSVEATLRKHDEKARLATGVVRERFGWDVRSTERLLILPDVSTARRRVDRHDGVIGRAYPMRGVSVRRWLRRPDGPLGGLLFLSATSGDGVSRRSRVPKRVRAPKSALITTAAGE